MMSIRKIKFAVFHRNPHFWIRIPPRREDLHVTRVGKIVGTLCGAQAERQDRHCFSLQDRKLTLAVRRSGR
jgi:hypothetical protein